MAVTASWTIGVSATITAFAAGTLATRVAVFVLAGTTATTAVSIAVTAVCNTLVAVSTFAIMEVTVGVSDDCDVPDVGELCGGVGCGLGSGDGAAEGEGAGVGDDCETVAVEVSGKRTDTTTDGEASVEDVGAGLTTTVLGVASSALADC
jgi:hypothetical protein